LPDELHYSNKPPPPDTHTHASLPQGTLAFEEYKEISDDRGALC